MIKDIIDIVRTELSKDDNKTAINDLLKDLSLSLAQEYIFIGKCVILIIIVLNLLTVALVIYLLFMARRATPIPSPSLIET